MRARFETDDMFVDAARTLMREWVKVHATPKDGCECPVCGRLAKVYKRAMNDKQALFLLTLLKRCLTEKGDGKGYVLVSWGRTGNGDYSKLQHWGLIEKRRDDEKGAPNSGWWRVTTHGEEFARGQVAVARQVYLYQNEAVGFSEDEITIRQAARNRFNYEEIMSEIPEHPPE